MGTLGTLAVSIIGDVREFQNSLNEIKGQTDGFGRNMQTMGRNIGRTGRTMSLWVTGPIAAVAGGILALTTKTGQFADELLDLEATTGIHTDTLQQYRRVSSMAGTDTDALASNVERMNRQMRDADTFSKDITDTTERLGVATHDTNGKIRSAVDVQHDLLLELADIEDAQKRAELGSAAFGRRWEEIAPVVALGREELEKMGDIDVIDREQLEAADEFRQAMDEMKHEAQMMFMELGTNLMPLMKDVFLPVLQDSIIPAIEGLVEWLGRLAEWFGDLPPGVQRVILGIVALVAAIGPVMMAVGPLITVIGTLITYLPALGAAFTLLTGPIGLIIAAIVAAVAIGWYLYNNWDEVKEAIGKAINALVDFFKELPGRIWNFLVEVVKRIIEWRSNMRTRALEVAKEVVNTFVEWIGKLPGKMLEAGRNIISNLVKGVRDAIPSIGGVMSSAAGAISNFWPFSPAKEGPLKQLPNFKSYLVDPAEDAIKDLQGLLRRDMDEIGQFLPGSITHEMRGGTVHHTGSLTVRGVSDQGQLVGVANIAMDQLSNKVRRDGRRTANRISKY